MGQADFELSSINPIYRLAHPRGGEEKSVKWNACCNGRSLVREGGDLSRVQVVQSRKPKRETAYAHRRQNEDGGTRVCIQ